MSTCVCVHILNGTARATSIYTHCERDGESESFFFAAYRHRIGKRASAAHTLENCKAQACCTQAARATTTKSWAHDNASAQGRQSRTRCSVREENKKKIKKMFAASSYMVWCMCCVEREYDAAAARPIHFHFFKNNKFCQRSCQCIDCSIRINT